MTYVREQTLEIYSGAYEIVGVPTSSSPGYAEGNPGTPGSFPAACETHDLQGVDRRLAWRCDVGAVQVSP